MVFLPRLFQHWNTQHRYLSGARWTGQVADLAIHMVGSRYGSVLQGLRLASALVLVLVVSEVLRKRRGLMLAILRSCRPDHLERQNQQNEDEDPAAHRPDSRSWRHAVNGCRPNIAPEDYKTVM